MFLSTDEYDELRISLNMSKVRRTTAGRNSAAQRDKNDEIQ